MQCVYLTLSHQKLLHNTLCGAEKHPNQENNQKTRLKKRKAQGDPTLKPQITQQPTFLSLYYVDFVQQTRNLDILTSLYQTQRRMFLQSSSKMVVNNNNMFVLNHFSQLVVSPHSRITLLLSTLQEVTWIPHQNKKCTLKNNVTKKKPMLNIQWLGTAPPDTKLTTWYPIYIVLSLSPQTLRLTTIAHNLPLCIKGIV